MGCPCPRARGEQPISSLLDGVCAEKVWEREPVCCQERVGMERGTGADDKDGRRSFVRKGSRLTIMEHSFIAVFDANSSLTAHLPPATPQLLRFSETLSSALSCLSSEKMIFS